MKRLELNIKSCLDCPYCNKFFDFQIQTHHFQYECRKVTIMNLRYGWDCIINDIKVIPDWCPLPNTGE